jgi:sulfur transfer complex TusBCD TusB component (DsrH family)
MNHDVQNATSVSRYDSTCILYLTFVFVNELIARGQLTESSANIQAKHYRFKYPTGDGTHPVPNGLEEFKYRNKGIIIPTYRGKRGHPVIISLKYKAELFSLKGDIGAREIIARHPEDVQEVRVDAPGVIMDIDTQEEYDSMQNKPD